MNFKHLYIFYYPPHPVFDLYIRIHRAGYILFVYNGATIIWIISVNNFRFFTTFFGNYVTNKYVLYIIRKVFKQCFCSVVLHKNIKIQMEMTEKSQIKYRGFLYSLVPLYISPLFSSSLFKYGFI